LFTSVLSMRATQPSAVFHTRHWTGLYSGIERPANVHISSRSMRGIVILCRPHG